MFDGHEVWLGTFQGLLISYEATSKEGAPSLTRFVSRLLTWGGLFSLSTIASFSVVLATEIS